VAGLEAILCFLLQRQQAEVEAVITLRLLDYLVVAVEVVVQEAEALLVLVAQHLHQDKVMLAA
jgi:hypothetical protein